MTDSNFTFLSEHDPVFLQLASAAEAQITNRIHCTDIELREHNWLYWRTRLYQFIHSEGDDLVQFLWDLYESKLDDEVHEATFGI